ncbi:MAG TPA: FHA domain-containing protein [Anaerolineales bacterium]|nr:FHA domain-containing protein [Anaerolineales bacterium]
MAGPVLLSLRLLLLIALYLLLFTVLVWLFRDLRQNSRRLSSRRTPVLTLSASRGSSDGPLVFNRSQVTLGRNPACDCVLDMDTISSIHARFFFRQGHWWIEDLNSTNGTYLNEERISIPVVLTMNDHLRFGEIEYSISWGER